MRVVLISDNLTRDYLSLKYVRDELEKIRGIDTYIVGSVAEIQRTYYYLYTIKPHIVFVAQVLEGCFRDIAAYVRSSGGIVIVLPSEITYSRKAAINLLNKNLLYDDLFDYYLVPGQRMSHDLAAFGIMKRKIITVGSPKMDILISQWKKFMSRNDFLVKYHLPQGRKNIFIFTTFIKTPEEYIRRDTAYRGLEDESIRLSRDMDNISVLYRKSICSLCMDFPEFNFILKPHPLESTAWYEGISFQNFSVIPDEYITNTLKSIDVAIHWYSTAAIECWMRGIKTIQYAPVTKYLQMLGELHVGNSVVSTYEDLRRAVSKYSDKPLDKKYMRFQKKYLQLWFGKRDGQSGKRIANVIRTRIVNHKSFSLRYAVNFSWAMYLFLFLDRIVGPFNSRRLMASIVPYKWRYAAENAILLKPKQ